jgi:predicted amidohydrolase
MAPENDRLIRLCVVQLDVVPQARRKTLWEPAEPRLDALPKDRQGRVDRNLSVATLFAHDSRTPNVYQRVLGIAAKAVTARLEEVLAYTTENRADIVVFPEYAIPVACLPVLQANSDDCAIVVGLGRIRNETDAAALRDAGADLSTGELVERNASVLVHGGRITVVTKQHPAENEDMEPGTGPITRTLRLGTREVRLGVAVCMDYLRCEEKVREQAAEILCIPAYTGNLGPFRPDAPRDHVRLLANCARYGGSTIMTTGLANDALGDDLGVRPVAAGHEAISMIEFDRFRQRPAGLNTPVNRLMLRSEIIERSSSPHDLLGRLEALLDRPEGVHGLTLTQLAADSSSLGGSTGPLAEALRELESSLQQQLNDQDLIGIARSHLVVAPGNRPRAVREEQAHLVWNELHAIQQRDARQALGAALDLYRPTGPMPLIVFDRNDYIERVLRQQRDSTPLPPVRIRYALDERHRDVPDSAMTNWVEQVVDLWERQADRGIRNVAEVCERFLAADRDLRDDPSYDDPGWWREQIGGERDPYSGPLPPSTTVTAVADMPRVADAPQTSGAPYTARARRSSQTTGRRHLDSQEPSVRPRGEEWRRDADRRDQRATSPAPEPTGLEHAGRPESSVPAGTATAEPQDDRVVIRWQVPSGTSDDVTVTVERLAGQGARPLQWIPRGNSAEDRQPPAGRLLEYLIRIQPADPQSEPTEMQASTVFLPPVTDPAAEQTSDGDVRGRWRSAPGLWGTRVWRRPAHFPANTPDRVPVSSDRDGFRDPRPPAGRHAYSIVPVYRGPEGELTYEGRPETVEVTVVNRPPVPRLAVEEAQDASAVALRWQELPPGVTLLLRRAAAEPPGTEGDVLTLKQVRATGQPVSSRDSFTGTTASVGLPGGRWVLVPFAVAGNLAVRGHTVVVDAVPAVTQAEAARNGRDVLVSWVWPKGMRMARIVWQADGAETVREVTLHDYQRLGGVRFTSGGAAEARISGIFRSGTDVLVSAPVVVQAPPQRPTLTYNVRRLWPWQVRRVRPHRRHGPRWWCAARRLILTADLPCTGLTVEVYVRAATGRPDSEIHLQTFDDVEVGPDCPHEVILELPDLSALSRPWYLSCQARTKTAPIRVDDFSSTGREIRPCFR